MSMVAKILIVLNLILAVAVMGAAGAYLQSAENWKQMHEKDTGELKSDIKAKTELISKQQGVLDEANRKTTAAETARSAAEAANRTLSENNTILQKKMDDYNATLTGLEAKLRDLSQNLDSARQSNEKLASEKKQADDERRGALEAKNAAETEQKRLEAQVADLTAQLDGSNVSKNDLKDKLEAANTALTMYKTKFGPLSLVSVPVKGMILAANAEMDIYLISVGEQSGVRVADELTVFRGDQFIAQVVVDKVYADKASVYIKKMNGKPLKKGDIRQGDSVATVY
jgi:predicted RNase H-like nuclease (RuvC/YqgF family)